MKDYIKTHLYERLESCIDKKIYFKYFFSLFTYMLSDVVETLDQLKFSHTVLKKIWHSLFEIFFSRVSYNINSLVLPYKEKFLNFLCLSKILI